MIYRKLEIDGRFGSPPELAIEFDGRTYSARHGEPLAVTLLAHEMRVLGRSSKYHRSRGLCCGRGTCGSCLAAVDGLPNQRLCQCEARAGRVIEAQNTVGSASFDLLSAIDWLFADGFDHHHFMTANETLNRFAVTLAHKLAGLGRLPATVRPHAPVVAEQREVEVAIVGGGAAGLGAAAALRSAGREVLVLEARPARDAHVSGAPPVRDASSSGAPSMRDASLFGVSPAGVASSSGGAWARDRSLLEGCPVLGLYDDRELLAVRDGRLVRVRATAFVLACGAHEQPPPCAGNDLPGLLLLRAAELALSHGVLPGRRLLIAVDARADDVARAAALQLGRQCIAGGAEVVAWVGPGELPGARSTSHAALAALEGGPTLRRAILSDGGTAVECDAVVWCGARAPAYELARQVGLETPYSVRHGGFLPQCRDDGSTERPEVFITGELAGVGAADAAEHGRKVGERVAASLASRDGKADTARAGVTP